MKDYTSIYNLLKENMTFNGVTHKRFYHSCEVAKMALKLNQELNLGLDEDKVYLAGLLHDAAKLKSDEELWKILQGFLDPKTLDGLKDYPLIWHSFAGKVVVKNEYGITDEEILDAIYYHTTGRPNMTTLEKVIFASDYIEATRVGDYVITARNACFKDLDYGITIILSQTVDYLKKYGKIIYGLTNEAFKYYENKFGELMVKKVIECLDKAVVSDVRVYDMRTKTPFYDYSIICSANTSRQGAACVEYIRSDAAKLGLDVRGYDSSPDSGWFLVDLNDIIVHIFVGDEREHYNLDEMYSN